MPPQTHRIVWQDRALLVKIGQHMTVNLRMAGQWLRDQAVRNVSRPVTKEKSPRTGRIRVKPGSRSKPGEFPKAETTRLMKDIFYDVFAHANGDIDMIFATSLFYGALLETEMDRSFLRRTFDEQRPTVQKIVGRPMRA